MFEWRLVFLTVAELSVCVYVRFLPVSREGREGREGEEAGVRLLSWQGQGAACASSVLTRVTPRR